MWLAIGPNGRQRTQETPRRMQPRARQVPSVGEVARAMKDRRQDRRGSRWATIRVANWRRVPGPGAPQTPAGPCCQLTARSPGRHRLHARAGFRRGSSESYRSRRPPARAGACVPHRTTDGRDATRRAGGRVRTELGWATGEAWVQRSPRRRGVTARWPSGDWDDLGGATGHWHAAVRAVLDRRARRRSGGWRLRRRMLARTWRRDRARGTDRWTM